MFKKKIIWCMLILLLIITLAISSYFVLASSVHFHFEDLPLDFSKISSPSISLEEFENPNEYIRIDSAEGLFDDGSSWDNNVEYRLSSVREERCRIRQTGNVILNDGSEMRVIMRTTYSKYPIWRKLAPLERFEDSYHYGNLKKAQRRDDLRFDELLITIDDSFTLNDNMQYVTNSDSNNIFAIARLGRKYFILEYQGNKSVEDCIDAMAFALKMT